MHRLHKRATPEGMMKYKHALELYTVYNANTRGDDWLDLNVQQRFNNRNHNVNLFDCSPLKVGKNISMNRMTTKNNQINYDWLNLSYQSYKIKC